jgi:hypothetical protein
MKFEEALTAMRDGKWVTLPGSYWSYTITSIPGGQLMLMRFTTHKGVIESPQFGMPGATDLLKEDWAVAETV